MSIAFLHSLLRNMVLYFGPFVIIASCLILSIGNVDVYKIAFNQNNFYSQVANEFNTSKPLESQNPSIQDEFYNRLIWNNIDSKLNSKDWLQNVTETNIDRANLWIKGTSNFFEPYLPLNLEKVVETKKPDWWNNIAQGSNKAVEELQTQAKKLNIPNIDLSSNLEIPKSSVDFNSINPIYQVNQTWVNLWNGLRGYYWQLQSLAWAAIIIYSLLLIGLLLTSVFFGKDLLGEFSIIARKLGFNLLISTVFFILSMSAIFLAGAVIKSLIPSSFLIGNIASIINWQIIWLIVSVMTPALILGAILTVGGLVTSFPIFGKTSR